MSNVSLSLVFAHLLAVHQAKHETHRKKALRPSAMGHRIDFLQITAQDSGQMGIGTDGFLCRYLVTQQRRRHWPRRCS